MDQQRAAVDRAGRSGWGHGHARVRRSGPRRSSASVPAGRPASALICGTGFAPCTDVLADRVTIPFEDLGFRPSAIPGHVNEVDVGELAGVTVAATQGQGAALRRRHAGGERPARRGAWPWPAAGRLLYSANSGSMRDDVPPGLVPGLQRPHRLLGRQPAGHGARGRRLADALPVDGRALRRRADGRACARRPRRAGVPLPTGVAGYWMGPSFETPAEIRLARRPAAPSPRTRSCPRSWPATTPACASWPSPSCPRCRRASARPSSSGPCST